MGDEGAGETVLERVMDYAAAATVAESCGIAQKMLDMFTEVQLLKSVSMASMLKADDDNATERHQ